MEVELCVFQYQITKCTCRHPHSLDIARLLNSLHAYDNIFLFWKQIHKSSLLVLFVGVEGFRDLHSLQLMK